MNKNIALLIKTYFFKAFGIFSMLYYQIMIIRTLVPFAKDTILYEMSCYVIHSNIFHKHY